MEAISPLHYKMYAKIQYQDCLTQALLASRGEEISHLNEQLAPVVQGDMAALLDQENIHGWLAAKIDVVESRLAYALAKSDTPDRTMFEMGVRAAEGLPMHTLEDIYEFAQNFLLDAMPCDRAVMAVYSAAEQELLYKQVVECHLKYEHNLLSISPLAALQSTCAGDHDHEDHEAFHVNHAPALEERLKDKEISYENLPRFYKARWHWLLGFIENTEYTVTPVNDYDFLFQRKHVSE